MKQMVIIKKFFINLTILGLDMNRINNILNRIDDRLNDMMD